MIHLPTLIRNALLAATLFIASHAWADPALNSPRILSAEFGVFNKPNSGKPLFAESKTVPYLEGQGFGWVILLQTDKPKVRYTEELVLPEKPESWGPEDTTGVRRISADGRSVTTERLVAPIRGMILNTWSIAPGDPKGHHLIRVSVEGNAVRTFEFDVQ